MKKEQPSKLQLILSRGDFAVTAECGPPRGSDPEVIRKKAELLKGFVDAVNVAHSAIGCRKYEIVSAGNKPVRVPGGPFYKKKDRDDE